MSDGSDQGKCPIERGGLFRCCGSPQACEGIERLAAWRRSREKASECARDENGHMVPHDCGQERHSKVNADGDIIDWREASIAAGPQERELPTPIQLPQCRFCGGPGHAYGERCLRDLSGRPHSVTSPSAVLAMVQRNLDEFKSRHFAFPTQPLTVTQAQQLVHTFDIALSAIHEALSDLYTGRL